MLYGIEETTGATPKALLDAPKIHGTCQEIADAYSILSKRRNVGFGASPIQLSEIIAFIQLFDRPSVSVDVFVHLIGVMDTKYLELSNKDGDKPTS